MDSSHIFLGLLDLTIKNKYSDIHLSSNSHARIRNHNGDITIVEEVKVKKEKVHLAELSTQQIGSIIEYVLGSDGYKTFLAMLESDSSFTYSGFRFRINCYRDVSGDNISIRSIPKDVPTLESLGLGSQIEYMCNRSKGLILITGPTGTGKSTNMAAMIDYINKRHKKHIITIEDPIEFVFHNNQSLVHQREVGPHTKSFKSAIKASLREDPDVILIGEMRDPETIKAAITLAETGHLVFSTLHTNDCAQSIDRIIDVFPGDQQDQIRMQLAMSLVGVVSQRLIPKADESGRVAAREIMINNDAIRNLIRTGNTHQIYSAIEISKKQGMILMDHYLLALYDKGIISFDTLCMYVRDKDITENMKSQD